MNNIEILNLDDLHSNYMLMCLLDYSMLFWMQDFQLC